MVDDLHLPNDIQAVHAARRAAAYRRVVHNGALHAQPFSEGNQAAAGKQAFTTTATRQEGGWRVNGRKIFASLSGAADYYVMLATEDKPNATARDTLFLALPKDADGLSIVGDWDPLGMRGTVSRTLLMNNVFVPDELQMMPAGRLPSPRDTVAAHVSHSHTELSGLKPSNLRLHRCLSAGRSPADA